MKQFKKTVVILSASRPRIRLAVELTSVICTTCTCPKYATTPKKKNDRLGQTLFFLIHQQRCSLIHYAGPALGGGVVLFLRKRFRSHRARRHAVRRRTSSSSARATASAASTSQSAMMTNMASSNSLTHCCAPRRWWCARRAACATHLAGHHAVPHALEVQVVPEQEHQAEPDDPIALGGVSGMSGGRARARQRTHPKSRTTWPGVADPGLRAHPGARRRATRRQTRPPRWARRALE